jgi:hypothetical protein
VPLAQDIDTAKKLLADAGYKDGLVEMMAWTGRAGWSGGSRLSGHGKARQRAHRVNTVPAGIFLANTG